MFIVIVMTSCGPTPTDPYPPPSGPPITTVARLSGPTTCRMLVTYKSGAVGQIVVDVDDAQSHYDQLTADDLDVDPLTCTGVS